jgi:hypothetical protein
MTDRAPRGHCEMSAHQSESALEKVAMVRSLLGVGCITTVLILSACGDDPDKAPIDRKDGGAMGGFDAGEEEHDGGPSEGGAGNPMDAGSMDDAGHADGDGGDGIDFVSACLDEAASRDSRTEKLKMSGEGTSIGIVRYVDPDAFGTSGTTVWLPERFVIARGATAKCLTDSTQLAYQVSHHNFDDSFSATEGDLTWVWKQMRADYGVPTKWTVEARQDDQLVWGPVELTLETCMVLNDSSACSEQYQ